MKMKLMTFALAAMGWSLTAGGADTDDYMQHFARLPQLREVEPDSVYLARLNQELDRTIADLKGGPLPSHRALEFGGQLNFAHSAYVKPCPLPILLAWVDALKAAGAARIEINPGIGPWAKHDEATIAKYDAVVKHVRQQGLKLALNLTTFSRDVSVRSLAEFKAAALPALADMARRFQPDHFVLVHEPTTLALWMKVQSGPEQWADYLREAAPLVKKASPKTRVGAGVFETEEAYLAKFAAMPEVEFLTIDIYFLDALPTFVRMIETARKQGKDVYIEETWRFAERRLAAQGGKRTSDILNQIYEGVDKKWLEAMVLFSEKHALTGLTPYWSAPLFVYLPESVDRADRRFFLAVAEAVRDGKRTGLFTTYHDLAQRYGQ